MRQARSSEGYTEAYRLTRGQVRGLCLQTIADKADSSVKFESAMKKRGKGGRSEVEDDEAAPPRGSNDRMEGGHPNCLNANLKAGPAYRSSISNSEVKSRQRLFIDQLQ